ncbi:MAG: UDP-N-acetylmuramoyl-L-alanyl-D-glutamate--2,6-diaminopimelate ligase, partial [Acidimicrobiales bacterium]
GRGRRPDWGGRRRVGPARSGRLMELPTLLAELDPAAAIEAPADLEAVEIAAIDHDSRRVGADTLFCALVGRAFDGHRYIAEAVAAGASAVLVSADADVPARSRGDAVVLRAPDTRVAMAHLAAAHAGHPSRSLDVVGITGTNGKTTTVHLLAAIAAAAGTVTRTLGTLTGERTTPEATDIQPLLASWVVDGVDLVVMEVSSHALVQHRVDGIDFTVAGFTNLTEDHLDFHPSLEDYFAAKARLFSPERAARGVAVADLPHGRLLVDSAEIPMIGIHPDAQPVLSSTLTSIEFSWRDQIVRLPFGGRFNVANATLAAEIAVVLGYSAGDIVAGLASATPVPGRFEPVSTGQAFDVIVDYAHTPDGLERVLASARIDSNEGRVLVVFGCGGDRDAVKRPLMGRAAEEGADVVIVTSDNPRTEDPGAIISEVLTGMSTTAVVIPDRRDAIGEALALARPGDAVVVAGKGHETTQTVGSAHLPFDDRQVVRELLAAAE